MSALDIALAMGIVFLGATVQGSVGFGANLIAAPVLALIDLRFLPGPAVLNALVLTSLTWRRERAHVDRRAVGWALVGRVPGTLVGAAAVVVFDGDSLGLLFGVLVLFAVALSASGLHLRMRRRTLMAAGAASGLMGTATAIGGPPIALAYQDLPGARLRASMSALFFIGVCGSVVTLTAFGQIDGADVGRAGLLAPASVAGFLASSRLRSVVDRGWTRPAVLGLSAASSVAVIARSLL